MSYVVTIHILSPPNMNHISNQHHHNHHPHHATTKIPLTTTTTTTTSAASTAIASTTAATASWDYHLNMVMEHHHHQQAQEQGHDHDNHHTLHHLIPLLDPVWHNYNPLPTHHPSPSLILKGDHDHDHHHHHDHDHNHEVVVEDQEEEEEEELGAMKEMMYRIAVMQPVDIDPATIRKPKRRNVRISDDPQSVAARHRRERISEKIRILQRLVPGGTKMDTASMLDEAVRYVKFLKRQIRQLQHHNQSSAATTTTTSHHQVVAPPPPPLPLAVPAQLHLGPSDWAASVVGPGSGGASNAKVVLREGHDQQQHQHQHQHQQGIIFQHGGNL